MKYYAHYEESAVFRIDDGNSEWTPGKYWSCIDRKLLTGGEYLISKKDDIVFGNPDYQSLPFEITREEYDTFGITWIFGQEGPDSKVFI